MEAVGTSDQTKVNRIDGW